MDAISLSDSGLVASAKPANLIHGTKMELKIYARFFFAAKSPAAKIQKLNKIKNYLAKFDFETGNQEGEFGVKFGSQAGKKVESDLKFSPSSSQKADGKRGRKELIRRVLPRFGFTKTGKKESNLNFLIRKSNRF